MRVCAGYAFHTVLLIDNLHLNLLLRPSPLPLLSAHPFLLWWWPAWSRSVSTGTEVNSDLPVCLFISCVFQVQKAGVQTGIYREWQLGANPILLKTSYDRNWSCSVLDLNVPCCYRSKIKSIKYCPFESFGDINRWHQYQKHRRLTSVMLWTSYIICSHLQLLTPNT